MEAYQSVPGGHLIDGIEKAAEYAEGGDVEEMRERRLESENERSLEELNRMMRSVK